ncbi:ATP-binding protein [uncultured Streptococcus sp.]|uniref:ATP-binding protein n=1 Tax=uncultured Streptococcus sp. TaxID=83427 RepID=UPI002610B17C|nr:ATP-binding protein [uncultured Streptococcus sp.]
MGVKYSASESSQLMEAMANNIQVANEVTDRLSQGCDHLIAALDSGELMGAAYTAGKGLFSEIIIPAIKKLQAAVDDIQTELNSYRIADAQVSEYGNLDLDQLKKTKELREKQLASIKKAIEAKESFLERMKSIATFNIVSHMESLVILSSAESQIESQIKELEEKIEKLEFFVAQVSQYFSDSLEVLRLAIQGATQLSEIIVDSDGNYYADGVDMNWVKKMKEQKIETHQLDKNIPVTKAEKEKKVIVDDLQSSYNMDESTANVLYKLQQGILKRAKQEGWTNEKVIYEYNRLVASPVYGVRATWRGLAGVVDAKNTSDLDIILADYGISEEERILFKEKIRKQYESNHSKDLAHEAIQIASFTELSWGDRDLSKLDGWKGLSAHIISTIGNSTRIGDLSVNTEKYESSFKGDIDSGRYDDADFNSDLDAITSYERMISKDVETKDVFKVQADYNHSIQTNQINRVEEFYTVMGNGDKANGKRMVETLIENNTIGGNFIKYGFDLNIFIGKPNDKEEGWKQDFYNYLDRGDEKNVGT